MRVFFIPGDMGGAGFYRTLFPARELRDQGGHEVGMPQYTARQGPGIVLLEYSPQEHGIPRADVYVLHNAQQVDTLNLMLSLQAQLGAKVVFDTDDLHHDWPPGHPSARNDWRAWTTMLKHADLVTVSTPFLADFYRPLNERIVVLPNRLDWRMWEPVTPVCESRPWRKLRVGWTGWTSYRHRDLDCLRGVVGPLCERYDVEFVAAGDKLTHDQLAIPEHLRVTTDRVNFAEANLADINATFDIAVVPLLPCPFNEAKSCLKGMEAAACGIPCVAHPSEQYRGWVEPGVNGFLASKPSEWRDALERLIVDDDLRVRMGRAAREKAAAHVVQRDWHHWETAYAGI